MGRIIGAYRRVVATKQVMYCRGTPTSVLRTVTGTWFGDPVVDLFLRSRHVLRLVHVAARLRSFCFYKIVTNTSTVVSCVYSVLKPGTRMI